MDIKIFITEQEVAVNQEILKELLQDYQNMVASTKELALKDDRTSIVSKALATTAKKYKNDYEKLKAIEELKREHDEAVAKHNMPEGNPTSSEKIHDLQIHSTEKK